MRPNASGTTRANTSLTIGSLNDRKIFVTRSSAGSITCGTIHKRSKAYFVLFFNSHVELLMRAYIVGTDRKSHTHHRFGMAWVTFALAVAVHVTDEAMHDFLST